MLFSNFLWIILVAKLKMSDDNADVLNYSFTNMLITSDEEADVSEAVDDNNYRLLVPRNTDRDDISDSDFAEEDNNEWTNNTNSRAPFIFIDVNVGINFYDLYRTNILFELFRKQHLEYYCKWNK